MDNLILILTLFHIAVIANPIAKGGGKSNSGKSSGKSSEKSSATPSIAVDSNTSSPTTTKIYYGSKSRCYRDYLLTIGIPCPRRRLSTGAIAGIAGGSILAVLLILLAYYFREKIMDFIKRKRRATASEDPAMQPLTKTDS